MNSVGKAINEILQNGTTALPAHPDFAKHDYGDTYITYRVSGITPFDTKDGPSDLDEIDVDVTIYSTNADTLLDLADKVRNDLDRVAYGSYNGVGLGGVQFQGEDSDYNDITERYECEQRYIFRVSKNITHIPPGGSCDDGTVTNSDDTFSASVASGGSLVLDDNTITDVDGTTRDVPAQTDVTCEWTSFDVVNTDGDVCVSVDEFPSVNPILPKVSVTQVDGTTEAVATCVDIVCDWNTLFVINTDEDILATVPTYPTGNRIELSDVTITEVNNSDTQVPAGDDYTCQWFDIVLKDQDDNTLDTIESYPAGGEFEVSVSSATAYPFIIAHRKPQYTTGNTGDYPTLFAADYFDLFFPSGAIEMVQLGADNFTLASNNRFGNTSRYTATDGTPSDTGTARFSSYGSGVDNIVRDNLTGVMWYNLEINASNINWDNAQAQIDIINTASLGGYTDWIRATRDMITISGIPDNNQDSYTSPNLFISDTSTALRRYMTCELAEYSNLGFFVASNGGEASQSRTSTASGQNRVIACRLMTLTELFG